MKVSHPTPTPSPITVLFHCCYNRAWVNINYRMRCMKSHSECFFPLPYHRLILLFFAFSIIYLYYVWSLKYLITLYKFQNDFRSRHFKDNNILDNNSVDGKSKITNHPLGAFHIEHFYLFIINSNSQYSFLVSHKC